MRQCLLLHPLVQNKSTIHSQHDPDTLGCLHNQWNTGISPQTRALFRPWWARDILIGQKFFILKFRPIPGFHFYFLKLKRSSFLCTLSCTLLFWRGHNNVFVHLLMLLRCFAVLPSLPPTRIVHENYDAVCCMLFCDFFRVLLSIKYLLFFFAFLSVHFAVEVLSVRFCFPLFCPRSFLWPPRLEITWVPATSAACFSLFLLSGYYFLQFTFLLLNLA